VVASAGRFLSRFLTSFLDDLIFFTPLFSAALILFWSSESLATSSDKYSSTVVQPPSDLSAIRIKAEPSFRFKGNRVQIELNAEISGNINVVLSELGKECTKSCKVIGGFVGRSQEEEQVNTNRRQVPL
jgi:hypothetical protein